MSRVAESLALSVEYPADGVVVVRVAGDLDRFTAPRLTRLLDAQLERCAAAAPPCESSTADRRPCLIVDLDAVRYFGPDGLPALQHAQYTAEQADIGLLLTGLSARAGLLPGWAAELTARFEGHPTLEKALAHVLGEPAAPTAQPGSPRRLR